MVMSSNRELEKQTKETLRRFADLGMLHLMESGSADAAFARCRALSWTCNALRERPERDVVLMMDDDMEVSNEVATNLIHYARTKGEPASAVYATLSAKIAASRWADKPGYWLVGLGCVAIPRQLLLELEARSESFEHVGGFFSAFTWCGPDGKGSWIAEDFRLSMNLGGVRLLPLAVGHIKKGALYPDDDTLERLKNAEPTP